MISTMLLVLIVAAPPQASKVDDWYVIPVYLQNGSSYVGEARIANDIWAQAHVRWQFTSDPGRGVTANAAFVSGILPGIGGFGGRGGRVVVKAGLPLDMRGEVLAHELGHVLGLRNRPDSRSLMGPGRTQRRLSSTEVQTARSVAERLVAVRKGR